MNIMIVELGIEALENPLIEFGRKIYVEILASYNEA